MWVGGSLPGPLLGTCWSKREIRTLTRQHQGDDAIFVEPSLGRNGLLHESFILLQARLACFDRVQDFPVRIELQV